MSERSILASSQIMELQQLLAAPLVATIEADAKAAVRYLEHLFELAFESYDVKKGTAGKLRTLNFSYTTGNELGSEPKMISIPILSLMPLPLLQVKEADFEFDVNILEASSLKAGNGYFDFDEEGKADKRANARQLYASIAPSSNEKQADNPFSIKVRLNMQQADVPGGLANLLQLTANI